MPNFHDSERQRRNVLLVMMAVTATAGLFFVSQNLQRGLFWGAVIEAVFVAYSVILMPVVLNAQHLRRWTVAYVVPWSCAMIAILAMPGSSPTVFIWPVLLPLVLHFLLGRGLGLVLSTAGLLAAILIGWQRFGWPHGADEAVLAGNLVLAAVLALLLAHVYERGRELSEQRLHELATTDTLTQLPNRMLLDETFERFSAIARRRGTALSLLIIDLDHFKRINDCYGHAAGDRVLVEFARLLRRRLRGGDFICRHGGEEFLALLPETDAGQAAMLAEALRTATEATLIEFGDASIALSISIGVAELAPDAADLDAMLRVADRRLYRAKSLGRNRVVGLAERSA
ncbi:MAG: GGDEF domain-containing protein [Wenzhouxiangellaceae bacterium]|nr:GGDEF domain-containing protein [Wenzhouxiangellaceae bacterium]